MLSNTQTEAVTTKEKNVVIMSAAASGKTKVLTERVNYLLDNGVSPKDIVVLTFTNAAAAEMRKRVKRNRDKIFMGTIHSYANQLLLMKGYNTKTYLQEEDFDKLFEEIKKHPNCIEEVKYLLLDEAQDSNESQFQFILDMIKPLSFFLVGDNKQSIYSWRGGRPDIFYDISQRADVKTYYLNENYRNGLNILNYAKSIINKLGYEYYDDSIAKSSCKGEVIETDYNIGKFVKMIKETGEYKDWFVLTRTNQQLNDIYFALAQYGIPCDTFKRNQLSDEGLVKKMKKNTVKILTIHTAKGLENKNVIVIGAKYYNPEERRVAYVAATRAKEKLIWVKSGRKKKF